MHDASGYPTYAESFFERSSRLLSLFVLAPLLLILSLPVALHIAQKPDLGLEVHQLHIVSVTPGGPADAAGLLPGDHIVAANGRIVNSWASWFAATAGHFDLGPQRLTVRRHGRPLAVTLIPVLPSQASLTRDYSLWVVGLTFLLIGWWVFTRRHDPVARNFFSLCFIFAFFLLDIPDLPSVPYMTVKEHLQDLLQLLLPAFFLRFFLQFPSDGRRENWGKAHYRLFLVPALGLFLATVATVYLHPSPAGSGVQQTIELASLAYMLIYFLASLVIFARRGLRRDRPIQRTKMVVILLGLAAGLTPFLTVTTLGSLNPGAVAPHVQYLAFSLLLVPASFALAIMRYGALDKAFVVRISLVYGLLTLFMLLMYFLVVVGIGYFLGRVFAVDSYPVLVLIIAGSGLAILPMRRVIQGWIDQAFYPSRRANHKAMKELANRLTGLIDSQEVVSVLTSSLLQLYRPQSLALFLRGGADGQKFLPRFCSNPGNQQPDSLPVDSALTRALDRFRRPLHLEEIEGTLLTEESDAASLSTLTRLHASLLVPLVSGNRLLGFLAFGNKTGGQLYGQEDLANLHALAVQSASVVESRQLYQESLERKRLETELEVARDLQRKLLPAGSLHDPCFVITGRNEPCRMVGGDYFDYFQREDGNLCVAIADVAGKGIPAALQMTSLQFAFRQLASAELLPSRVIAKLNAAVTTLVSGGGFVCFFFGVWDPESGLLNYCNAGMEPPVLFRPGVGHRQSLRKGGPVLGVAGDFSYAEGTVALRPGDRLFFYTDGLTDERNRDREFFDTERLLDLVAGNMEASPKRLIETVFAAVNAFGGDQKEDDKTAILLEIKKLKEPKAMRSHSC